MNPPPHAGNRRWPDAAPSSRPGAAPSRNVWAFLVIVPLIAAGLGANVASLLVFGLVTPVSLGFGAVVSAAVIGLVWWLLSRSVLWRPAGAWPLLALAWGAGASFVFVISVADSMTTIATALGWEAAEASLAGAWPEEVGKSLGIALILLALPRLWNRPWDGLLVGIFVGLGFELIETVQYGASGALDDPNSDVAGLFSTWLVRSLFGPGLHVFFSGVAGFGVGVALLHPRLTTPARWAFGLGGPGAAFAMHFLWNYTWPDTWGVWWYATLWALCGVALVACWRAAKRMEKASRVTVGCAGR